MMHRRVAIWAVLLLLGPAFLPAAEEAAEEDQARAAALLFGTAMKSADLSVLRPVLPEKGKIQLRLVHLGPEEGFFSSSQVEALLRDFLEQGSIRSFDLLRVEYDANRFALAHGRALLSDREGRPARVNLHLAFQPEDGRWVLREIRETRP